MPRSPKLCQISRWVGGTPLLPRLWTITGLHDSSMHFQQAQDEQDLMALRKTGQSLVGHLLRQWAPASTATSRSAFLCQRDDDQSGPSVCAASVPYRGELICGLDRGLWTWLKCSD